MILRVSFIYLFVLLMVLLRYTKFPMVIPSPGPGYNTVYEESYLESKAKDEFPIASISKLVGLVQDTISRGYCQVLGE